MTKEPRIEAAILDLDGVVTDTAVVHEQAWKRAFDGWLASRHSGPPFTREEYLRYVDGRPRLDGVRAFVAARGLWLPEGAPDDEPGFSSVHALAALKNDVFHRLLAESGVHVYEDATAALATWRAAGLRTAVVTASRNAAAVLAAGEVAALFEVLVDGVVAASRGLAGKPAPDTFLEGARLLGVPKERAMVIEDAVAGVRAALRGGFGLVVGVSRDGTDESLRAAGADVVVHRLTELPERPQPQVRREVGVDKESRSMDATSTH